MNVLRYPEQTKSSPDERDGRNSGQFHDSRKQDGNATTDEAGPIYNVLPHGGLADSGTGLRQFGTHASSPAFGRWTEQDPAGYVDGVNTYQFVSDDPLGLVDPTGLDAEPVVDSIKVEYASADGLRMSAFGAAFNVKITVTGKNLCMVEMRQLIKSSTKTLDYDGRPLNRDQILAQSSGDPNVIDSNGKFEVDTEWDWTPLDDLTADNTQGDKQDSQLINVANREVTIGDTVYTEVQRSTVTRDFELEIRKIGTDKILKTKTWGYTWSNAVANWGNNINPPPPEGDVVAGGFINTSRFSNVYGIEGLPARLVTSATQPSTSPATQPSTQPAE